MTGYRHLPILLGSFLLPIVGCSQAQPDATAAVKTQPDATAAAKAQPGNETAASARETLSMEDRLREIAGELRSGKYAALGGWNRAISLCMAVTAPSLDFSDAPSDSPHVKKIYQPWAKDPEAYLLAARQDQPIGQVIVKESWVPKEVAAEAAAIASYAERDGKRYSPHKPSDLFIMFKVDPTTPDTDQGWVYGIVTPDGKQVISSGRIASCVNCHRQARHDRVFGEKLGVPH